MSTKLKSDSVKFLTPQDLKDKSNLVILPELKRKEGLIKSDGEINWGCPCIGGMAVGPCGFAFREAFSCYHYSSNEIKGSECTEFFAKMQECFKSHPKLYSEMQSTSLTAEASAE